MINMAFRPLFVYFWLITNKYYLFHFQERHFQLSLFHSIGNKEYTKEP